MDGGVTWSDIVIEKALVSPVQARRIFTDIDIFSGGGGFSFSRASIIAYASVLFYGQNVRQCKLILGLPHFFLS